MDLNLVKFLYLVAIFVSAWIGVVIVLCINPRRIAWLSIGCAGAGGIFLVAGLVHLMPDARESLSQFKYPWTECTAAISFIFFLALEKVFLPSNLPGHGHNHNEEKGPLEQAGVLLGDYHSVNDDPPKKAPIVSLRSILLMLALGIHSILEGIAIGVQADFIRTTSAFVAVVSHKWSAGAATTISCRKDKSPLRAIFVLLTIFSLMSPIGIGIGMAVFAALKAHPHHPVFGFLTAAASGTFLYVSIVEILCVEFDDRTHKWPKFIACFLGAAFMSGIAALES
eukprot:gnl/Trimastix_PCT/2946.p1 GENE.gnl/Trimastix_PCT/2946~~gnl/Trimastix_PCT/2946.p1  ORF type:complete len:282 (+),score=57.48 gnl/Trimastix_PCT/2946:73-918(+)